MRNEAEIEIPLVNIDRNPLFLLISVIISTVILYFGCSLLQNVNGWGFIVLIPGTIISFQTLWLLLNPFALVYSDKIEIKQSFFHHKFRYFVDIKKIIETKNGKIYITYNDDEVEAINLFGIKASHLTLLKTEIEKSVNENIKTRS